MNEYENVTNDFKNLMQTLGGKMRAVRLRRSRSDVRPCDALRRYVLRAEAHAAEARVTRRTRWGAAPSRTHKVAEPPMPAVRLFALSRYGLDVSTASAAFEIVLARVRAQASALMGVQPMPEGRMRAADALVPSRAEDASAFASMFAAVCVYCVRTSEVDLGDPSRGRGKTRGIKDRGELEVERGAPSSDELEVERGAPSSDELEVERGAPSDVAQKAVRRHMHRKLLGFVLKPLYEVQDFISIVCGGKNCRMTAQKERWMAALMAACTPLASLYGMICGHTTFSKMMKYSVAMPQPDQLDRGASVVYARWNLENDDTYVGETFRWAARVKEHYKNTRRHERPRGKGCSEGKYLKQAKLGAARWMMTPLQVCASKEERKLLETKIRRKVAPSLNRWDRAVRKYTIEHNYVQLEREENRRRRTREKARSGEHAPWRGARRSGKAHDVTRFWLADAPQGPAYLSLTYLLDDVREAGREVGTVEYHTGFVAVGAWRQLRRTYGETVVKTHEGCMQLSAWCEQRARQQGRGSFEVVDLRRAEPLSEHQFILKHQIEDGLSKLSDDRLMFLWLDRKKIASSVRGMMIRKIWDEHEIRYEGLTRQAIKIRIPFVYGLDTRCVKQEIGRMVQEVGAAWPAYVREWHVQNVSIVTASRPTIADVMCNVNKPWLFGSECVCDKVHERLAAKGWISKLPSVENHIFVIGREYSGPCSEVLRTTATNVPKPTAWDVKRTWSNIREQLPAVFRGATDETQWLMCLEACRVPVQQPVRGRVNTAALYTLRKVMQGLVCGPLDKNGGELSLVCPVLYEQAVSQLYDTAGGDYVRVHPKRMTAYRKRAYRGEAILSEVTGTRMPKQRQKGGAVDVVEAWRQYYKHEGWHKIVPFDSRGRLGTPYALFKAKNVTDPVVRQEKWKKARPISPTFHHPMARLLHLAGRAWYFLARNMRGEHLVIDSPREVPHFLREAERVFGGKEIDAKVLDIEGCYPNMPKEAIRHAMLVLVQEARRQGRKGVSVPSRSKTLKCSWKQCKGQYKWLDFETLLKVLDFSLNQAVCSMKDGRILLQVKGIPMGDALSPAMTIATCAWMEREWMASLDEGAKRRFVAKRYMDDILLLMQRHGWDRERFAADFQRSECYMAPLCLEEAPEGTFLETMFRVEGGRIRFRLKNVNTGGAKKVWRYHAWDSYVPEQQKRSTLLATLKKVDCMASDEAERLESALDKLREFEDLGYPVAVRRQACRIIAEETGGMAWLLAAAKQ